MFKFIKSLSFALSGLKETFKTERNFRFHLLAAFFIIILGFVVNLHKFEWITIFACIFSVLIAETFNTSIENLNNAIQSSFNPHIKKSKDIAAAAVLLTSFMAILIGFLIFTPRIIHFIKNWSAF